MADAGGTLKTRFTGSAGAGSGAGVGVGDDSASGVDELTDWFEDAATDGEDWCASGGGGGAFLCFILGLDSGIDVVSSLSIATAFSCAFWYFLGTGGSKPTRGPPCCAI